MNYNLLLSSFYKFVSSCYTGYQFQWQKKCEMKVCVWVFMTCNLNELDLSRSVLNLLPHLPSKKQYRFKLHQTQYILTRIQQQILEIRQLLPSISH